MYVTKQFSIFMVNKPGVLAQVLGQFATNKLNIIAMTVMDSAEHGVMRVVFTAPAKAQELLARTNVPHNEAEVLCVTLDNKSGALAAVVEKLSKAKVNITYAYVTAGARGGRTTAVLKIPDLKKAMKVLEPMEKKGNKTRGPIRRAVGTHR